MPSSIVSTPFLSLRPDDSCGRANGHHPTVNGDVQLNGVAHTPPEDEFLRLGSPQQDLLLLHGPRQRYSLERAKDIPEVRTDDEILIQVLAIGLNPVDWKGADYGFSQPSYPWVNGRDFAGIVVKGPRKKSRIHTGDVVFGPSTDYRDVRKAAYQEFTVASDFNVARVPEGLPVKTGAAVGVAFTAAAIGLGVSLGLDFSSFKSATPGPDLPSLLQQLGRAQIPEDVRSECLDSIAAYERPKTGEWLAIWGASSTTGIIALQLAKLAGLRVICVADIAKNGSRLIELGADMLADKYDVSRTVNIIRTVTGNNLRFALDITGSESATAMQDVLALGQNGMRSHLLGFSGLPKQKVPHVVQHNVPIKIFHETAGIGEALMTWLEALLLSRSLKLPEVEVADGGLAGINDALDRLRRGEISGKRLVVPVLSALRASSNGTSTPNGEQEIGNGVNEFAIADKLNSDPDRVKFAYWVPNVSGGLVISKIPQRTKWDLKSNINYARTAERAGIEYALSQIRFMAGYGAENQHEPVTFSQALLHSTERLKLIIALLPGPWNPAVAAKQIASIDNYTDGRASVNVVSGWFKTEFTSIGQWWLDHAERYRRTKEFIQCLKGIWTQDSFSFSGDFYQFHDYTLKPKPLVLPDRPHPEIFQGGNSGDARDNAATVSDFYFMNGNTLEGFISQIDDVRERAAKAGRAGQVKFAVNGFVICRDTEAEAIQVLREIQGKADAEAVEGFRREVQNAGAATSNKTGMWAQSGFEDLVQYNDGFKTKLIGTKEQIAERIMLLKSLGVDIVLTAFLHYEEEIRRFGEEVLPLVRRLEAQGRGKNRDYEIALTGDVYRSKK